MSRRSIIKKNLFKSVRSPIVVIIVVVKVVVIIVAHLRFGQRNTGQRTLLRRSSRRIADGEKRLHWVWWCFGNSLITEIIIVIDNWFTESIADNRFCLLTLNTAECSFAFRFQTIDSSSSSSSSENASSSAVPLALEATTGGGLTTTARTLTRTEKRDRTPQKNYGAGGAAGGAGGAAGDAAGGAAGGLTCKQRRVWRECPPAQFFVCLPPRALAAVAARQSRVPCSLTRRRALLAVLQAVAGRRRRQPAAWAQQAVVWALRAEEVVPIAVQKSVIASRCCGKESTDSCRRSHRCVK